MLEASTENNVGYIVNKCCAKILVPEDEYNSSFRQYAMPTNANLVLRELKFDVTKIRFYM
jgi:hypothetical protein